MTCPPAARPFVISLLALLKDLSLKEIGSRIGMEPKKVSYHLQKRHDLNDEVFELLLRGVSATPGEIAAATACYEALAPDPALTQEEKDIVEGEVLEVSRWYRAVLVEAIPLSRAVPLHGDYPRPDEVEASRWLAGIGLIYLKQVSPKDRLPVIRAARELQTWALCERIAEESVQAASRDLEESFHWARLARHIANRVQGPEGWRKRLRAYATAVFANTLRVAGQLKAASRIMREAKRLWRDGSDPDLVLDPGRLLDLEGSLLRGQRRFPEALATLDAALLVSRSPARILTNKAFTLEVMGEYDRAVEALLEAEPRLNKEAEPRIWYSHRFNLGVILCHLRQYSGAAELAEQVREVAINLGDEIFLHRVTWLQGRVAAGLGQLDEARKLLEQAREAFAAKTMYYDVALALMEEAAVLLNEGRTAEVKTLTLQLTQVFQSKGVHLEALSALSLFKEVVEREEATAELAYRVLAFLFRARYDPGLSFTS